MSNVFCNVWRALLMQFEAGSDTIKRVLTDDVLPTLRALGAAIIEDLGNLTKSRGGLMLLAAGAIAGWWFLSGRKGRDNDSSPEPSQPAVVSSPQETETTAPVALDTTVVTGGPGVEGAFR